MRVNATKVEKQLEANGMTACFKIGGTLEKAAMANHASTRTMQLDDRHRNEMIPDDVERLGFDSKRTFRFVSRQPKT